MLSMQPPLKSQVSMASMDTVPDHYEPIGSATVAEQESWIIEDLLYVLMEIDGKYIRIMHAPGNDPHEVANISFRVDPSLDSSLADLTNRILPLASHYVAIQQFIETHSRFEYGRVNHALCGAIRTLLKEYFILIAQLEHQAHSDSNFSLQKLWFYLSPSFNTMASIASLIRAINATEAAGMEDQAYQVQRVGQELSISARGGGVLLGILSERMTLFGGDPATKQLCAHLLSAAAVPYFAMLRNWIHFGEVADPYDEFMVQERRGLSKEQLREDFNDIYWEQRYTLREDVIPSFLQPYKDKILLAGKYLNVVRECGVSIADVGERVQKRRPESARFAPAGDVMKAIEGGRFPEDIELAYQYANETLLELLFKDQKLRERLRSVKHYFFLDQSDFLVHFLDVAHEQLLRPSHEVPLDHVRSLLELVLRNTASVSSKDAYNEDVVAELSQISLVDQLLRINSVVGMDVKRQMEGNRTGEGMGGDGHQTETDIVGGLVGIDGASALNGIAAFMLGYTVRFPLSLVLNKKVMTKYQLLFRHLFHCKYVERQLSDSWREQGKSGLYQGGRRFGKRKGSRTERRDFGEVDAQETELEQRERREDGRLVARMCALRGKMLHLVQQFMYYVCFEVLEPSWESLDRQLAKVTTVDEVLVFHNGFLDTCLKDCMLTNPKLIKIFSKIMTTCTDFSSFCVAYLRHKSLPYRSSTAVASLHAEFGIPPGLTHAEHPSASPAVSDTPFDPLQSDTTLKNFERDFVHEVRRLIDALQFFGATETASLGNLVTRMDYNMYYARLPPDLSVVGTVPIRQGGR